MRLQFGVFVFGILAIASSSNLLGGFEEVDLKDKDGLKAVAWVVKQLSHRMNSIYHHVLLGSPKIELQVARSYKYHIIVNLAPTTCRNNEENLLKTIKDCPLSNSGMVQQCDTTVWFNLDLFSMETFSCHPVKTSESELLGQDSHDYVVHRQRRDLNKNHLLGQDNHDYISHGEVKDSGKHLLGQDNHDYISHGEVKDSGKHLFGQDTHDYISHGEVKDSGKHLLGQDNHDYISHGEVKDSGKHLFGQDTHDYISHGEVKDSGKHLLGQDNHDYISHGEVKDSGKHLFGQDTHDYIPHTKSAWKNLLFGTRNIAQKPVHHMEILGGDDTDFKPHQGDHCMQYSEEFKQFKRKYKRLYGSFREEAKRFQIFCTNMDKVKEYQKMERGTAEYGATIFADLSVLLQRNLSPLKNFLQPQ